ncbi:MAG: SDR family oxidoreductase [Actinobacteria bacterium]|nr:SDR family oxidoreductase [Actinomycetota bacterium]
MELGLRGRACIVTGASRGIGAAAARALSAEGASVLLVARDASRLEAVAGECERAATIALDVTRADSGERAMAACRERFGSVDVLVNNAGAMRVRPLQELTDADWREQWELNVMASLRFMRAAAPLMAEQGWGRIVNVSSSSGKRPSTSNVAYAVAKSAQLALSRAYADAYAASGVLVNAIAPGPIESPLWTSAGGLADQSAARKGVDRERALEEARSKIPLGRFGTEDEVAAVIAFLCSERASDVAGAAWSVDGGSVPSIV